MRLPVLTRRGFTLVEAVVCTVVVGVMLAASLKTVAAARSRLQHNQDAASGIWLAQSLVAEIMDKAYIDPGAAPLFGPEVGENQARRESLNDVDDYQGLVETPRNADGTAMSGLTGWKRSVTVAYVLGSDPQTTSLTDTGIKRFIVSVSRKGVPVAELRGLRSKARDAW